MASRISSLLLLPAIIVASNASAQSGPPAHPTWHWPLYEVVQASPGVFETNDEDALITSAARPNVWGSHGAFEEYGDGTDPHPGIDIRGDANDVVEIPIDGEIVHVQNGSHCEGGTANKCRIFIRTPSYLYYLGHFEFRQVPDGPLVREMRDKIAQGSLEDGAPDVPINVKKKQQIGQLEEYLITISPTNQYDWAHLHISIFDPTHNYDNLNPLWYMPSSATGLDGTTVPLIDDERPFVGTVRLEVDGPATPQRFVIDSRTTPLPGESTPRQCGLHVRGQVDVLAHLQDTFSTHRPAPNPFNREFDWNDTIGVYGARFIAKHLGSNHQVAGQWYQSPANCTGYACGAWRFPFSANHPTYGARPASFDPSLGDAPFMTYLQREPPSFMGWDFSEALWKADESSLDHFPPNADFQHVYFLTNRVNEMSDGPNDFWDTDSGPEGVYAVTVEAWDHAGNVGYNSTTVTVNRGGLSGGSAANFGPVISKDHDSDFGQSPSTPNGEVFWHSPDIIVLRQRASGAPEPPPTQPPTSTALVAGETYEVWVRVHNTGCVDSTNVRAKVWTANPATRFEGATSLGQTASKTVPGGASVLVGPLLWTVTSADLDDLEEGHRCLLAEVASDAQGFATGSPETFDVAANSRVVQRNVQTTHLYFDIKNVGQNAGESRLHIDASMLPNGARFQLLVERTPELEADWDGPCSTFTQTSPVICWVHEDWYVLEILQGLGDSPTWTMPPVTQHEALALYDVPAGHSGTVVVSHLLDGAVVGGMTFHVAGATIIR